jgi:hypothetical protein
MSAPPPRQQSEPHLAAHTLAKRLLRRREREEEWAHGDALRRRGPTLLVPVCALIPVQDSLTVRLQRVKEGSNPPGQFHLAPVYRGRGADTHFTVGCRFFNALRPFAACDWSEKRRPCGSPARIPPAPSLESASSSSIGWWLDDGSHHGGSAPFVGSMKRWGEKVGEHRLRKIPNRRLSETIHCII